MICEYCHQEFIPQDAYRRKYCSPKHKNLAGAKARAARNVTLAERRCYRCKEVKPTEEFSQGGTHAYCKVCYNAWHRERSASLPVKVRQARRRRSYERERAKRGPAALNAQNRRYRSGLTDEQLAALLDKQGGGCAICHATEPGGRGTWHFDHDHTCCPPYSKGGKQKTCGRCVRGLLCTRCNVGLGHFRHDPQLLTAAAEYLARYQTV